MVEDSPTWSAFQKKLTGHPSISLKTKRSIDFKHLSSISAGGFIIYMKDNPMVMAEILNALDMVVLERRHEVVPRAHINHALDLVCRLGDTDRIASLWKSYFLASVDPDEVAKAMGILISNESHRHLAKAVIKEALLFHASQLMFELFEDFPGLAQGIKNIGSSMSSGFIQGARENAYYSEAVEKWADEYLDHNEVTEAMKERDPDHVSLTDSDESDVARIDYAESFEKLNKCLSEGLIEDTIEVWDEFIKEVRSKYSWLFAKFVGDQVIKWYDAHSEGVRHSMVNKLLGWKLLMTIPRIAPISLTV